MTKLHRQRTKHDNTKTYPNTGTQTGRQAARKAGRQTDRQIDRQTDTNQLVKHSQANQSLTHSPMHPFQKCLLDPTPEELFGAILDDGNLVPSDLNRQADIDASSDLGELHHFGLELCKSTFGIKEVAQAISCIPRIIDNLAPKLHQWEVKPGLPTEVSPAAWQIPQSEVALKSCSSCARLPPNSRNPTRARRKPT